MKKFMEMIYAKAKRPEDLVWHCETPSKLLVDAIRQRGKPGTALDLGCGAGVYSAYLAKHGYEVTGLDFIPKALEMAEEKTKNEGVKIDLVHADLLEWQSTRQFDLVLDSGTLHNISSRNLAKYKAQLLRWLKPDSDYILSHWGKRHALDWRPVGPWRRTRAQLTRWFAPQLREKAYDSEVGTGIPFPIGPSVLFQSFWFQKAN